MGVPFSAGVEKAPEGAHPRPLFVFATQGGSIMANTAIFGIYATRAQVEQAVDRLRAAGFRATDISVLFPENVGTKELAHEKHTKAPEGAAAGATSGALLGGTLGWLVGIGALAIPGLGPFLAAGPIVRPSAEWG
jgi:hypothetical protein